MISDPDIARKIGCGPEQKKEWWEVCCNGCGQWYLNTEPHCPHCRNEISICAGRWAGPDFTQWGEQTGLLWDWLVQKWGVINIHAANANSDAVRIGYPLDGLFGDTLPLALCMAVEKARTE